MKTKNKHQNSGGEVMELARETAKLEQYWIVGDRSEPRRPPKNYNYVEELMHLDLDCGVAEANAIVSGSLFAAGKGGNVVAQIFWLKTRAQWRERAAPDDRAAGGDADTNSPVVLVLPDNGRDPELVQAPQDRER